MSSRLRSVAVYVYISIPQPKSADFRVFGGNFGPVKARCNEIRLAADCTDRQIVGLSTPRGLPRDWGSGCGGDFGERLVRGEEALPEAGAERAVVDGAAD